MRVDLVHVEWWKRLKSELFAVQGAREGRSQGARDSGRGGDAGGVCTPGRPTDRGGVHRRRGTPGKGGGWEELSSAVEKVVCEALESERRRNAVEDAARRSLIGDGESHGRFLCAK